MIVNSGRIIAAVGLITAICLFIVIVVLVPQPEREGKAPDAHSLVRGSFDDLPGWADDAVGDVTPSWLRHCGRWKWRKGDVATAMQATCAELASGQAITHRFLQDHFDVWILKADGPGLLTGYFEPTYAGRRDMASGFEVPILPRPDDLISVDLGAFRPDLKGNRIAGRINGQDLEPYPDRTAIRQGALSDIVDPIFWLSDPVDLFFLQIQGSGRIALPGGDIAHVGYAAQNGQPYRAIGRDLIEVGAIRREDMSMQAIRQWLSANPDQADAMMDRNPSYVFFQERTGVTGAIGAAGTQLTPLRSIAVDRKAWQLGLPMFVSAPAQGSDPAITRLAIAEDTGGAIRGPRRADFFLGAGDEAARLAGSMNRSLSLWLLYPKGLIPDAAEARP
ncbi:MAG: MltA domain-containing protein [Minwuia sp.]|nr:MltA domain-containing protein [Minwuia sp.]